MPSSSESGGASIGVYDYNPAKNPSVFNVKAYGAGGAGNAVLG
jgi:hypothetical protein